MPIQMNLWSLTLYPGEAIPIFVRRDFQITNAALDEELEDENARTSVSVTHFPVPLHPVDSDDEDFDSDEFDSDEMADDDEDEEVDEEEIAAKVVKAGGKVVAAEVDDEEDDEEDDDEDSDDDLDFDEMAEQETNVLCSLTGGKIEQAMLNLTFVSGDVVRFQTTGPNVVHLIGNYIYQGGDSDDEDSDDEDFDLDGYSDELDSEDEFSVEEFDEADVAVAPKGKIELIEDVPKKTAPAKADKKRKAVEEAEASPAKPDGELSKAQKKKLAKKARLDAAADEKPEAAPAKQAKKRTLPSGLVIEDVKTGTGPVAKAGKRLGMRYIGKLTNGKQFDANTGGKPFSFVLGRGEVIGGWEQGLAGMAVGGERRLTVPPKLAYGSQKLPGIPANSTLVFDVKLVSVN